MFPLAFVAGWLQGHWCGFISRNYVVWPIFFLTNVFIALKGSHFWFLFLLQFCTELFETLLVFSSWYEDVHMVWRWLDYFLSLFPLCELSHFSTSMYIDSGYLVSTIPHTILYQSFWNFTHVFSIVWKCACVLDIILELIFVTFSTLWTSSFSDLRFYESV